MTVVAIAGCCAGGGGASHKCDFTPPNQAENDAGTDGPMLCGTAVCDMGQVCCYKKAPPLAICINPADFETFMCEKMNLPCFTPTDCPDGTACCLNIMDFNNLTVSCKPQLLCPGDGVDTLLACGSEMDCPAHAPTCTVLGSAMGKDFKVCEPGASPPSGTTTP